MVWPDLNFKRIIVATVLRVDCRRDKGQNWRTQPGGYCNNAGVRR